MNLVQFLHTRILLNVFLSFHLFGRTFTPLKENVTQEASYQFMLLKDSQVHL
jgi:hypothetical protein